MQLYEQIENVPKYKNGSNAIPKDEIVIQYSAFKQSFIRLLEGEIENVKSRIEIVPYEHHREKVEYMNGILENLIKDLQEQIKILQM